MNVQFVRPQLGELVFLVYSRPLHPELFGIYREQRVQRDDYQAVIRITDTGHVIEWTHAGRTLSELVTTANGPFPKNRRMLAARLRGERSETLPCGPGIAYQMSFGVERMARELFQRISQELEDDARGHNLCHNFQPKHRLATPPLSHVVLEARARSLLVHAFHTFPDDLAIVRTQSLFECAP
jgi:hypothetical protein